MEILYIGQRFSVLTWAIGLEYKAMRGKIHQAYTVF